MYRTRLRLQPLSVVVLILSILSAILWSSYHAANSHASLNAIEAPASAAFEGADQESFSQVRISANVPGNPASNEELERISLDRRIDTPEPSKPDGEREFEDWRRKGNSFLCAFPKTRQELSYEGQDFTSRFLHWEDLKLNGWEDDFVPDQTAEPFRTALSKIGVFDDGIEESYIEMKHHATGAFYDQWFDVRAASIIISNVLSPTDMAEQDKVPPLKYWSDVAFLQWVDVAHAYEKHFQNIKHFVILGIDNDYTLQIIWQVLYNKGRGGHPYQSIDEAATIPMSDPDGQALLASPNARGCAQFLLTHKPQLGLKMITGVKIFGPDYISQEIGTAKPPKGFNRPEMVGVPSGNPGLVFFVEDVTSPET